MSGRKILLGSALGIGLWFLAVLYFVVAVQAVRPESAARMREMASAGFLPMALISALVLVRQGRTPELARVVAAMAGGVVLWIPAAGLVRRFISATSPSPGWLQSLPALDLLLLLGGGVLAWWFTGRIGAGGGILPPRRDP